MIRRVFTAYLAEWIKYARMPLPYIGMSMVLALVGVTALLHPIRRDGVSDFDFIAIAVPAALNLGGFLMVLVYAATLISAEVDSGTIRTVLVRPIQRHEFFLAKLLNGLTFAFLVSMAAAVGAWLAAMAFGDLSGIAFGEELMYAPNEIYSAMAIAFALNLAPHFAGVACALFVSAIVRKPAVAIGLCVGAWLVADYGKHIVGLSAVIFTTYLDQSWVVVQDRCSALSTSFFPDAAAGLAVSGVWFAAFTAAGALAMVRRNFGP